LEQYTGAAYGAPSTPCDTPRAGDPPSPPQARGFHHRHEVFLAAGFFAAKVRRRRRAMPSGTVPEVMRTHMVEHIESPGE